MNVWSCRYTLLAVLLMAVLTGTATADTKVKWIWADHLPELYDAHIAAWDTPVAMPPGAIHWRYNQARAREAVTRAFPMDRQVIQKVEIVDFDEPLESPSYTVEKVVITPGEESGKDD